MPAAAKPWEGVIPPEDVEALGSRMERQHRPMTAGSRPGLIVVDMTLAFVDSSYPSGFSPTGWPCVASNASLLAAARATGIPVFFTKAYHDEDHRPTAAERGRWKREGVSGPTVEGRRRGDVIVEALSPREGEHVVCKAGRPSGFSGTPLASYMIHAGCDTAIVTGMTTSGCVRATLLDAFQLNFHCVVPFECVADVCQLSHKVNLFDLHMKYADVVSLEETIGYLESLRAS